MTQITPSLQPLIESVRVNDLIDRFVKDQDDRKSSVSTYRVSLKQYFRWIERKQYKISDISRSHLIEFKSDLLQEGKKSNTIGSYLTAVRLFYIWTESNLLYPNIARAIKSPKRKQSFERQPLTDDQSTALLDVVKDHPRDFALISLLLRTGLRTIEAVRCDIEDITTIGGRRVLMVQGKGRDEKDSFMKLTDKAWQPIADYLETRSEKSGPLFVSESPSHRHERLSTRTIRQIVKFRLYQIGIKDERLTAHSLRHTAATNVLIKTGDLEKTRIFCRHNNPATTLIYVATLNERRRLENSGEDVLDEIY